jgi:hypothetical protein
MVCFIIDPGRRWVASLNAIVSSQGGLPRKITLWTPHENRLHVDHQPTKRMRSVYPEIYFFGLLEKFAKKRPQ